MKPFPNPLLKYIDRYNLREVGLTDAAFTVIPLIPQDTMAIVINTDNAINAMYLLSTGLTSEHADVSAGLTRILLEIMAGRYHDNKVIHNVAWVCPKDKGGLTLCRTTHGISIVAVISYDLSNMLFDDYLDETEPVREPVTVLDDHVSSAGTEVYGHTGPAQDYSELDTSKLVEITGTPIIATPVDKPTYADYAEFAADVSDKLLFTNPDIDGEYIEPLDSFQVTAQSVLGLANVIAVHSTRSYSFDNDCLTNVLTEITDKLVAVEKSEDVTIVQNHYSNQLFIDHEHFTLPATTTEKSLSGLLIVYGRLWLKDNTFTYAARVCEVPTTT